MPICRRLRVMQILHGLARAGTEKLVHDLSISLKDQIQTEIVCLDSLGELANTLNENEIPVHLTERKSGIDFSQIGKIRRLIAEFQPDVVHCHQYTPWFYGTLAHYFSRCGKIIFTEHGRHYPDVVSWKRRQFNGILNFQTSKITAVCEFTKRRLIEKENLPASKIEIIYNGVELKPIVSGNIRQEVRAEFGMNENAMVIVQVGTFRAVKDHATGIRAFKRVCEQNDNSILLFLGDGEEKEKCLTMANEFKLTERVRFAGVRADVARILSGSDVMLQASLSEAHSVSILEGMERRLPIVATDVGGNGESVSHGETGFLAPAGDDTMISDYLLQLIRNESLRKKFGESGRRRVMEKFDRHKMQSRYLELYQSTANGN